MKRFALLAVVAGLLTVSTFGVPQVKDFVPVTDKMLVNPNPDDWLMYSRTYDAQRFSPLQQITRENVSQLKLAWSQPYPTGTQESIPVVYRGVLYTLVAGTQAEPGGVNALNGATGDLIWSYKFSAGSSSRTKSLAIYEDMIYTHSPDRTIVAIDAKTGVQRWKTTPDASDPESGVIIVEGKVLSGRTCSGNRSNCYLSAYDARTGKEVWKFFTAAGSDDAAGDASWGGAPESGRFASTWGLAGGYDPVRRLIYWGVANPTPNTRAARHAGDPTATARTAPADLYSNSTIALSPDTGRLAWYYQHLPGDDWDQDYTNERILLRTPVNPDPKEVKWINPKIQPGSARDIAVMVGEGGGIFALDRGNGQFLWASPFPYDVPNFLISNIDADGRTTINYDLVMKEPGDHHLICFYNVKSYWPMAYHPGLNSLYVPFVDNCLDMTSAGAAPAGGGRATPERRVGVRRPEGDPQKFAGLIKVNMATGKKEHVFDGPVPGNGAALATAGNLVFWGDLAGGLRAFDAESNKLLWQTKLPDSIQNSTITYAVNGKQYVMVYVGRGQLSGGLLTEAGLPTTTGQNGVYVFALP